MPVVQNYNNNTHPRRKIHRFFDENYGLRSMVARKMGVRTSTVGMALKNNRFSLNTKVRMRDALNEILGTNYSIIELFAPEEETLTSVRL